MPFNAFMFRCESLINLFHDLVMLLFVGAVQCVLMFRCESLIDLFHGLVMLLFVGAVQCVHVSL